MDMCDCFASADDIKLLDISMEISILNNMEAIANEWLCILALSHKLSQRFVSVSDFTDGIPPSC